MSDVLMDTQGKQRLKVSPPIIWVGGWDSGEERVTQAALFGLQYVLTSKEKRNIFFPHRPVSLSNARIIKSSKL